MKIHYHLTSCSIEVPLGTTIGNPSSIGEEPVPKNERPVTTIIINATSSLVSYTEQGIITFTNVLQGHNTVVMVCCTSEPEADCTRGEEEIPLSQRVSYLGIGKMLHICSLSEVSQVHRRTTRHHTHLIILTLHTTP